MKAVASRVTEKSDVLLLAAVDMDDSGPYEIAEPRVITALETYTPSCKWSIFTVVPPQSPFTDYHLGLQTPRLKRLAEIVSAQAIAQQEKLEYAQDDSNDLTDSELNGAWLLAPIHHSSRHS
jgi:myosin-5